MESAAVCVYKKVVLVIVFCALVFWLGGCGEFFAQPGETVAEGRRRHARNARINHQELMEDIDMVMLFDKPRKLTEKRIP